jgi:hypothetical protein
MNNLQNFINSFNQFKNMFNGDPKQQVQQLLNSGRINQAQYDAAVKKANEILKMMNT